MELEKDKFVKSVLLVNKWIVKFLICILTLCLILASVNLIMVVYDRITKPPFLVIEVDTLYEVFSLILIIAIGYEMVKSLLIIIFSQTIPSLPIVQIAIIAVANKIITLDIKHTDSLTLFGLAALMVGLGITYFSHRVKKVAEQDAS